MASRARNESAQKEALADGSMSQGYSALTQALHQPDSADDGEERRSDSKESPPQFIPGQESKSTVDGGRSKLPPRSESDYVIKARETEEVRTMLAAATAARYLQHIEKDGSLILEKVSVYGAAIALPQVARSANWSITYTMLAIRSQFNLVLNVMLQLFLLTMIGEAAQIMDVLAGKMHLCDFGKELPNCPDPPRPEGTRGCEGPGGTQFTPPRLFDFDIWSVRMYVRDALLSIHPNLHDEIMDKVDPGEYGIENYYCRMVCCFIFMVGVTAELRSIFNLVNLLWYTPSKAETWITLHLPEWASKHQAKEMHGWNELDMVTWKVAGMPRIWKLWTILTVMLPKTFIWYCVATSGFRFLMETASITNLILNSMAMNYILEIDEMLLANLGSSATKHIMTNIEDMTLFDPVYLEEADEKEVVDHFQEFELSWRFDAKHIRGYSMLLPWRLVLVVISTLFFTLRYYYLACQQSEDGTWISQDMYLPESVRFNPAAFLLGVNPDQAAQPFWDEQTYDDVR